VTATAGATIRYTLDGSEPSGLSAAYTFPFLVPVTTSVKAKTFKTGLTPSTTTTVTYQVDAAGATATPTLSLGGGRFTTRQTITVTGAGGATLRYTTTGVDPTDTDTTIASGATVTVDRSLVLKVRAWQSGLTPSAVRRADFLITGALAAGQNHSLALKSDRTLWAWGMNANGQLARVATAC